MVFAVLLVGGAGVIAWRVDLPVRLGWSREKTETGLTLYGNVEIRQVQLGFRVNGRLAEMLFEEGASVKAEGVLARLDRGPYRDQVAAARAAVAAQEANLAKLVAGPRPAEIAQAEAAVAERRADLENARAAFARVGTLRKTGTSSQASFDQAETAQKTAAARLDSAGESLRLLQDGSRSEDIAAARANLRAAQASLSAACTSLADTELRAPADGIILSRVREEGAIVSPGETTYTLSLTQPVWVRSYIGEPDLGRIHPGMKVEVFSDTAPDRPYEGTVGFISPVAEFTPKSVETPELRTDLVYRLRIIVENADQALLQGMPVTTRIPSAAAAGKPAEQRATSPNEKAT